MDDQLNLAFRSYQADPNNEASKIAYLRALVRLGTPILEDFVDSQHHDPLGQSILIHDSWDTAAGEVFRTRRVDQSGHSIRVYWYGPIKSG